MSRWDSNTGVTARYKIRGRAFKGEQDPDGTDATWVVSATAARAVAVVEQLQDPDENDLFALLPASRHRRRSHSNLTKIGYAGTSASGFRDEVESEEALARCERLGALAADPACSTLTGPAGEEAESRLAAFATLGPFAGKVITDPGLTPGEADDLAAMLIALLEGAHVMCRASGTLQPFDQAARAATVLAESRHAGRPAPEPPGGTPALRGG